jgi:hypothetical protein
MNEPKRCQAERDGKPCPNDALEGADLCVWHGGKTQPKERRNGEPIRRGGIIQHLKHAADERSGDVIDTLFDAMESEKEVWVTCRGCGKRTSAKVADSRTRVDAASKLVELGYGRQREREEAESENTDLGTAWAIMLRYLTRQEFENLLARMSVDFPDFGAMVERWYAESRTQERYKALEEEWLSSARANGERYPCFQIAHRSRGYIGDDTEGKAVYLAPSDTEEQKQAKRESLACPPPMSALQAMREERDCWLRQAAELGRKRGVQPERHVFDHERRRDLGA